jgi:hypothetical protein
MNDLKKESTMLLNFNMTAKRAPARDNRRQRCDLPADE